MMLVLDYTELTARFQDLRCPLLVAEWHSAAKTKVDFIVITNAACISIKAEEQEPC